MPYEIQDRGNRLTFTGARSCAEIMEGVRVATLQAYDYNRDTTVLGFGDQEGYVESRLDRPNPFPAPMPGTCYRYDGPAYRIVVCNNPAPYYSFRLPGICHSLSRYAIAISERYRGTTGTIIKTFFNIPDGGIVWIPNYITNASITRQFQAVAQTDRTVARYLNVTIATRTVVYNTKKHLETIFGEILAVKILKEIEK